MIAIVDYGVGNLYSLKCSLGAIGAECSVTGESGALRDADRIILPGVGAFEDAILKLRQSGLDEVILGEAKKGKPILGICLGMQMFCEKSYEYGTHNGLGLIKGDIVSISDDLKGEELKVPHMGWNSLFLQRGCPLLRNTAQGDYVYFVHSYYLPVTQDTAAFVQYGSLKLSAVVERDNVMGVQFHPEKSGAVGLDILRAFADLRA